MSTQSIREPRVLAVAPFASGIAYVLFNGPWLPIDWGIKWVRSDKNKKSSEKVTGLIRRYQPDILVFEDHSGPGSRRAKRIETLLDNIREIAKTEKIEPRRYSRGQIREVFSAHGAVTKYDIAKAIAEQYRDFAPKLPGPRKIWLPEHPNMSIFDAASLALTYFSFATPALDRPQAPQSSKEVRAL